MSKKDKLKYKPGLTPQQMEAQDIMLNLVKQGPIAYTGDTTIFPQAVFDSLFDEAKAGPGEGWGLPENIQRELEEYARTGGPDIRLNEAYNAQRKVAERSSMETFNALLAKGSESGSVFGSNVRANAVRGAAAVRGEMEAKALSDIVDYDKQRQSNRIQAYGIMSELAKAAQAHKIQVAQLIAAAKDLQNRLSWEVFKERNAEVAQMLHSLWGRNVDFAVEKTPNTMGPILTGAAFLMGTVVGGPAVGAGLATAVGTSQGGR